MNPVRGRMTQRATIQRDTQTERNPDGHLGPPEPTDHIAAQPCFLYVRSTRGESVTQARTVTIEELALLVPLGADITTKDRVNGVVDRLGNTILAGVQNIRSVVRHHHHLELVLEGAA